MDNVMVSVEGNNGTAKVIDQIELARFVNSLKNNLTCKQRDCYSLIAQQAKRLVSRSNRESETIRGTFGLEHSTAVAIGYKYAYNKKELLKV